MRITQLLVVSSALFTIAACSAEHGTETVGTAEQELTSGDGTAGECATQADVDESCCGFPGDRGNELGVGKFCLTDRHCRKNSHATVCSSFENSFEDHKSFFCTMLCDPAGPADQCGSGAACACEESGACGCTPASCIENLPAHCEEA